MRLLVPSALALTLSLGVAATIAPTASEAQVAVGVSVGVAPPPLPLYAQPPAPGYGYIWTPGYWGWSGYGYYWVPGTWVLRQHRLFVDTAVVGVSSTGSTSLQQPAGARCRFLWWNKLWVQLHRLGIRGGYC